MITLETAEALASIPSGSNISSLRNLLYVLTSHVGDGEPGVWFQQLTSLNLMDEEDRKKVKSKICLLIALCFAFVVGVSSYVAVGQQQQQQPQPSPESMKGMDMGEMNKRGDRVMGFDHDKTTHHFGLLPDGGFIQVEANDAQDIASRDQIRMHLSHIATMFAEGNFKAPMLIHDQTPPGVPVLQRPMCRA